MATHPPVPRAERDVGPLNAPSLHFDLDGEVRRLWRENASRVGRNAKTLAKQDDFRVVLTVLKAGRRIQEHKAAGRISIQAVQGHMRVRTGPESSSEPTDLPAGRLLVLDRGVRHDLEALTDSAFLLTVAWPAGERAERPCAPSSVDDHGLNAATAQHTCRSRRIRK
jgi:quercetin dioxygenase-like cupin family protein